MSFDPHSLLLALQAMPLWETAATILGIIYVLLAIKESAWCWVAEFFSTLIFTLLFWKGQMLSSAILNFYYMGMAIYGFWLWRKGKEENNLPLRSWSSKYHLIAIGSTLIVSQGIGFLFASHTHAHLPYLDAFVMAFSILATWLLTQKIVENWIYWITADSMGIILYWKSGYKVTIVLFVIFIVLSLYGYKTWHTKQEK